MSYGELLFLWAREQHRERTVLRPTASVAGLRNSLFLNLLKIQIVLFLHVIKGIIKKKKKKIVGKVEEVVVEEVEEVAFMEQVEGMEEMQLPARGVTTLSGSISWIKRRR